MFLAEAYGQAGRVETGLEWIELASTHARTFREGVYEAEIHRICGELSLKASAVNDAEAHLLRAIDIARSQKSKSLELRAAMALARLWERQGRRQDAYDLVAPIYGWFSEGFDTPDLKQAKTLLEMLA
jgi:predicted ATPase